MRQGPGQTRPNSPTCEERQRRCRDIPSLAVCPWMAETGQPRTSYAPAPPSKLVGCSRQSSASLATEGSACAKVRGAKSFPGIGTRTSEGRRHAPASGRQSQGPEVPSVRIVRGRCPSVPRSARRAPSIAGAWSHSPTLNRPCDREGQWTDAAGRGLPFRFTRGTRARRPLGSLHPPALSELRPIRAAPTQPAPTQPGEDGCHGR